LTYIILIKYTYYARVGRKTQEIHLCPTFLRSFFANNLEVFGMPFIY